MLIVLTIDKIINKRPYSVQIGGESIEREKEKNCKGKGRKWKGRRGKEKVEQREGK